MLGLLSTIFPTAHAHRPAGIIPVKLYIPIIPALCLILSKTNYSQNYVGIIGACLYVCVVALHACISRIQLMSRCCNRMAVF